MSSPLEFKVYSATDMVGAVRYAEDAALIVGNTDGGTVKWQGRIVWREGREEWGAGESYDGTAEVIWSRVRTINQRHYARQLARLGVTA